MMKLTRKTSNVEKGNTMKKLAMFGLALFTMLGCAAAFAQSRGIELEEIENDKPSFYVRVAVNHEDLIYTEDDLIEVTVTSSEDGYLYLIYKDAKENVSLLFPNKFHTDNKIVKGKTVTVPAPGSKFSMRVVPPFGEEQLLAVVTKKPIEDIEVKNLGDDYTVITKGIWDSFKKAVVVEGTASGETEGFAEHLLKIKTVGKDGSRVAAKENRFFLGFGVGSYKDPAINKYSLPACPTDVKKMADLFVEQCGVLSDNVVTFIDEEATLECIKRAFCEVLPEVTKPGDVIFVFWSGHGGRCADEDGDEKDGYDEYLVPYDAKRSEPSTMLLDDVFGRWV